MASPAKQPVVASGVVSHVQVNTTLVAGANDRAVRNLHATSFRVGGRPVLLPGTSHVADGDRVTVVGPDQEGSVTVVAMHNHTTGVETTPIVRTWPMWFLIAFGIPLIAFFGLGLLLIYLAIRGFKGSKRQREMIEILRRTPAPQS